MSNFVQHALEKKAADFQSELEAVMADKIAAALEVKKQEIAASMFQEEKDEKEHDKDCKCPKCCKDKDDDDDDDDDDDKDDKDDDKSKNEETINEKVGHIAKGAFHRWLGKPEDEPITAADIEKGLKAGGHAAKMANFARNFGHK